MISSKNKNKIYNNKKNKHQIIKCFLCFFFTLLFSFKNDDT